MNPLQIALTAAQIFGTLEPIVQPFAIAGIKAAASGIAGLIASLRAKKAAGLKMSFADIHAMAQEDHGVNMHLVYAGASSVGALTALGAYAATRALRK